MSVEFLITKAFSLKIFTLLLRYVKQIPIYQDELDNLTSECEHAFKKPRRS